MNRGFSLIELMIVIVILALFGTLLLSHPGSQIDTNTIGESNTIEYRYTEGDCARLKMDNERVTILGRTGNHYKVRIKHPEQGYIIERFQDFELKDCP